MTSDIAKELAAAEPRPGLSGNRADKKNYAERLSRALAKKFADALRKNFNGITPLADGTVQEAPARTAKGVKKLDVNYSTSELGLGLGVSIKTINFRDPSTERYTKNYTRVDNELRAEAKDYHHRQPYSVLVAVVFLPKDSFFDGEISSFGAAVRSFRHRARRSGPRDEEELFERVFLGVYEVDAGDVTFFDVVNTPRKRGLPAEGRLMDFDGLIAEIEATYDARNNPEFEWDESET